jgi:hypothetical protein
MKTKFLLSLCLMFINLMVQAQQGFSYKAVITNAGNTLNNAEVTIRFTILQNGITQVYQEQHATTTDENGIALANIGEGTPTSGIFTAINWGLAQSLKVEINSGSGYVDMGTTAFRFVPYAKIAAKVLDANDHDFYKTGTSVKATTNTEDIYHMGRIGVGSITYDSQLEVYTEDNLTALAVTNNTGSTSNNYGVQSIVMGNSIGNNIGTHNSISGLGSGIQYGVFNQVNSSGNGLHYGVRNMVYGEGAGIHRGTYNELFGTGAGQQIGSYQYIYNSNNANHYGVHNDLSGSGSGEHYGAYNNLSGTGNGTQHGSFQHITNEGNGEHYGVAAFLTGTGIGTKYGVFSHIPITAGGYHVAVYAKALKAGSYAAYLVGDTYMEGKLKTIQGGEADMKPYIYGNVNTNGAVSNGCSGGFSCSRQGTGFYRITFNSSPGSGSAYVLVGNILDSLAPKILTYSPSNDFVDVYTWNLSGTLVDSFFNFVVYKK